MSQHTNPYLECAPKQLAESILATGSLSWDHRKSLQLLKKETGEIQEYFYPLLVKSMSARVVKKIASDANSVYRLLKLYGDTISCMPDQFIGQSISIIIAHLTARIAILLDESRILDGAGKDAVYGLVAPADSKLSDAQKHLIAEAIMNTTSLHSLPEKPITPPDGVVQKISKKREHERRLSAEKDRHYIKTVSKIKRLNREESDCAEKILKRFLKNSKANPEDMQKHAFEMSNEASSMSSLACGFLGLNLHLRYDELKQISRAYLHHAGDASYDDKNPKRVVAEQVVRTKLLTNEQLSFFIDGLSGLYDRYWEESPSLRPL